MDKENDKLKFLNKRLRKERFQGSLDEDITTKDMAKLAKYKKLESRNKLP